MALTLMKGSEAIAEAAIRAGARYFFGYPITPQTEIPEYMSARMPEVGGCFLQAESEVAAINMIYGAAGAGARALTSSSSPGVSLKQEGISYCAGAQLPAVILNVMRGGPGLGNIQASQGDYFQGVKGGGNGDYHLLTYAPSSIQEFIDIMMFRPAALTPQIAFCWSVSSTFTIVAPRSPISSSSCSRRLRFSACSSSANSTRRSASGLPLT